jgi:hypothetical protein
MSNKLLGQCEMCGGPVMVHTRGPDAKYCGSKCRKTASRKCVAKRAIPQKRHRAKGKQKSSKIVVQNHELACHEFQDSNPSKVDLRAAPINLIGGHRFPGASRLPADLLASIFETEIRGGPGEWTSEHGVFTSRSNSDLTIRPDTKFQNMWRVHYHGRVSDMMNLSRAKAVAIDETPNHTAGTIDDNPAWLDAIQPHPLRPVVETVSTPQPPVMSPAVIALLEDDGHPSGIPAFLRRAAI